MTCAHVTPIDPKVCGVSVMRHCLVLDLKDDPALIAEYERHHQLENVWPEVTASLAAAGITNMEIYRYETRLVMLMETSDWFNADAKARSDATDPRLVAWENLMDAFQRRLPGDPAEGKWRTAHKIFDFEAPAVD